jgi:hypothetical protein
MLAHAVHTRLLCCHCSKKEPACQMNRARREGYGVLCSRNASQPALRPWHCAPCQGGQGIRPKHAGPTQQGPNDAGTHKVGDRKERPARPQHAGICGALRPSCAHAWLAWSLPHTLPLQCAQALVTHMPHAAAALGPMQQQCHPCLPHLLLGQRQAWVQWAPCREAGAASSRAPLSWGCACCCAP